MASPFCFPGGLYMHHNQKITCTPRLNAATICIPSSTLLDILERAGKNAPDSSFLHFHDGLDEK
jgi:hypothetical protein